MSALGQKQTYAVQNGMSALPPIATAKADICPWSCRLYPRKRTCAMRQCMSALGHKRTHAAQQKGSLFDDLIGGDQQARWNCQAKCLRRFAVDDSFELRRRLHRKVSGFCTAQDAVDIGCPLSGQIDEVSPVIHETARCDENTDRVNRGQAMLGCQRDNEITMDNGRGIWRQHQSAIRLTGVDVDGALDVGG